MCKENSCGSGSYMDKIYGNLLQARIVFVTGQVNSDMAKELVAQLLYLDSLSQEEITVIIDSPGGSVSSGMAIYDTLRSIRSQIKTVAVGMAASMGSIILVAGEKGKRCMLKNARVLLHQPLIGGFIEGQASDLQIQAKEILKMRTNLYTILKQASGQDMDKIKSDCERDFWLSANESVEYGLVDHILEKF